MDDIEKLKAYILQAAQKRGFADPNVAVRVAQKEGLIPGVWQSEVKKNGRLEPSYGPFQLLEGGPGTGFPAGMGNDFERATGLEVSDPANVYKGIDFALDQAKQGGWSPWFGAKNAGIGRWEGIGTRGVSLNSYPDGPKGQEVFQPAPAGTNREPQFSPPGSLAGIGSPGSAPINPVVPPVAANPFSGFMSGLSGLLGSMGGGGKEEQSAPIQSILPSMEAADAARTQGAAQLMATLLAKKREQRGIPGLSLMGMG